MIEFEFSRKKMHSFIADTMLQVDQKSSISQYLFKNQIFLKVKTTTKEKFNKPLFI